MSPDKSTPETLNLPPVVANTEATTQGTPEALTPVAGEAKPETKVAKTAAPPANQAQTVDPAVAPGAATPTTPTVPAPDTSAMIADDAELIEKEWVERAKEIVNKTKDNPYLQNKAITKMKVDYIKKRYNKDIRISGD